MPFGKRKLLAAFLEKDNVKLLVYEARGKSAARVFAGQITFGNDVVRDAFIADSVKFTNQVKIALTQKTELSETTDVILLLPPDKTFTKALPAADAVDSFVRALPYFKEELIIKSATNDQKPGTSDQLITHVAFEKKLIEDFERPFLESGKKVVAVESSGNLLAKAQPRKGKYFLIIPFEKDTAVSVCQDGEVLELAIFPKDAFVGRFGEFIAGHELKEVREAFTVGIFDTAVLDKLKVATGLTAVEIDHQDIYDVVIESYLKSGQTKGQGLNITFLNLPAMPVLPSQRYLFLGAAAIVGFVLVFLVVKNIGKVIVRKSAKVNTPIATPAPTPPPAPEPKPGDYKIRVLNGTLVAGEAGQLGDRLKTLGFDVAETKNATSAGFIASRLRVTADVPQKIIDQLKTKLLETYTSVTLEPITDTVVRIEIIIGTKK